jgi:hypothetical protein
MGSIGLLFNFLEARKIYGWQAGLVQPLHRLFQKENLWMGRKTYVLL